MGLRTFYPLVFIVSLSAAFVSAANAMDFNVAGYSSEADIYTAEGDEQKIGVVFLHGKGSNKARYLNKFFSGINEGGVEVTSLAMPWTDWDGDRSQAIALVNKAVAYYADEGKKTIVIGHSIGAMLAMHYAAEQPSSNVIGVVAIAPGHLIYHSKKMKEITMPSVVEARKMVANGEGDKQGDFYDLNAGSEIFCRTTANIYLSFFDPEKVADIVTVLPKMQRPLLWVAGTNDHLNHILNTPEIFTHARKDPLTRMVEVNGSHKSVTKNAPEVILSWIDELPK